MRVADLAPSALGNALHGLGLAFHAGTFVFRVRSPLPLIETGIATLYAEHRVANDETFVDYDFSVEPGRGWRRWIRPQAVFRFDSGAPFEPLPAAQAMPLLEWGMNWCLATQAHQFVIVHAAVVARDNRAVILPGPPGTGKSTLCAALVSRGWRLLSDEMALIGVEDGLIHPVPRPISLKNRSIQIIRDYAPGEHLSAPVTGTLKGDVALMRPPAASVAAPLPARPGWIIRPTYQAGAPLTLGRASKSRVLLDLANNSFNHSIHMLRGFRLLADLVEASGCYDLRYADLDEATGSIGGLPEAAERSAA